jgi:hypothetical protein
VRAVSSSCGCAGGAITGSGIVPIRAPARRGARACARQGSATSRRSQAIPQAKDPRRFIAYETVIGDLRTSKLSSSSGRRSKICLLVVRYPGSGAAMTKRATEIQ